MSLYQFFASDKKIKLYDNMKIRKVKEGDLSCIISVTPRFEINSIRIFVEEDKSLTMPYTDKKFCNYIEWLYTDENAEIIIEFIKEHLSESPKIELWNTWLGDKSTVVKKKVSVSELSTSHIRDIWGKKYFDNVECLVVYRDY